MLTATPDHSITSRPGGVSSNAEWTTADQAAVYQMDWKVLSPDSYAAVRFAEREQEGVAQNYTFHVDRAKFDQLLLEHASEAGAEVEFEATVTDVDFSDPEIVRITSTGREGGQVTTARMVADASGRRTFLGIASISAYATATSTSTRCTRGSGTTTGR
jgi:flavin-dependent dehydrogenase